MHDDVVFRMGTHDLAAVTAIVAALEGAGRELNAAAAPFRSRVLAGSSWDADTRVPDAALASQQGWDTHVHTVTAAARPPEPTGPARPTGEL